MSDNLDCVGGDMSDERQLPLVRICENIFENLSDEDAKAFFAAIPAAVGRDGKDLSRVHWRFLASELRAMPPQKQKIQAVIDPVIAGMDLLSNGGEWLDAADAANAAASAAIAARAARAADAAYAAANAAYAAANATAYAAAYAARAAAYATDAAAKATANASAKARIRQRDTILRLIAAE